MTTLFTFFLFLLPILLLLVRRRSSAKRVPPGSLGLPIIGQSISLLRAMRANTAEQWLQERVRKYGPVSKLSLFGKPAVFIFGPAAHKLIFGSDANTVSNQQAKSNQMILGDRNLLELMGEDHKRVRGALVSFLKPESLKQYVGRMDAEVRNHLQLNWEGKQRVTVLPLMKGLTFDIICGLLFGLEQGTRREELVSRFQQMIAGIWSVPFNLPFTRYNHSLQASSEVQTKIKELIHEKRQELERGASPNQDLITRLLSIRDENNQQVLSEDEIVHNVMLVMVAGHDTSAILITFMVRLLANDPHIYAAVLQEQEEIAKGKAPGEFLTWEDLAKMKYTWRVALETLRLYPPVLSTFRTAMKDIEFGGYTIPKGWKILWVSTMTHMDENIFTEPTKFDPTRFENQASIPPYCFIPFGGGARVCPGSEFARIETLIAIHHLVTRFKWKLCHNDNFFSRNPMPEPTEGLPIEIIPRA